MTHRGRACAVASLTVPFLLSAGVAASDEAMQQDQSVHDSQTVHKEAQEQREEAQQQHDRKDDDHVKVADVTGEGMPMAIRSGNESPEKGESGEPRVTPERAAAAVEDELSHDAMAELSKIDVQMNDGVATLSGSVNSLLARDRAARIAATVKGVDSVTNDILGRPRVQVNAAELRSTIQQALLQNPVTEAFQFQVDAAPDGAVRLDGNVESWTERQVAERVAKGVSGVTSVRNDVDVNYTRDRPDAQIAADVQRLLRWDVHLDDSQLDVGVHDGNVSLSGTVGSAAEKNRAINLAWIAGTQSVDADALKVTGEGRSDGTAKQPPAELTDEAIAAAVTDRLRLSPYIASGNVEVQVDDRMTTLRGTVNNLKAKRTAASLASQVYGVTRVRDRLEVATKAGGSNDRQLESRIVSALAVNPVTDSYEIDVDVEGGGVELSGDVDTWFEKGTADDVVARVRGVQAIDNRLRVLQTSDRLAFDPYVDNWSVYVYDWYQPERSTVWKLDGTIREQIVNELRWSPFVDSNDVAVSVQNGVATLTGAVDSAAESRAAQENAFEGGATGVINRLQVES